MSILFTRVHHITANEMQQLYIAVMLR